MTTINTIQDLLELLRSQPGWAEELRAILLARELLELPATVAALAEAVAELTRIVEDMNRRLTAVEQDVAVLKEDVKVLKEDVKGLKGDVSSLKGDVGRLKGGEYERNMAPKAVARTIAQLGFRGTRVVMSQMTVADPDFSSDIENALTAGSVDGEGIRSIFDTDLIIRSRDGRYALFEVSVTADAEDITRARARADILVRSFKTEVIPAVITANLPEPLEQSARDAGVTIFIIPEE